MSSETLRDLAGRIAEQLVAEALSGLVGTPVTITLMPEAAPRALLPAPPTRGRKTGAPSAPLGGHLVIGRVE